MKTNFFQRWMNRGVVAMVLASMMGSPGIMGCAVESADASPTMMEVAAEAPRDEAPTTALEAERQGDAAGAAWFSFGTKGVDMAAYNTAPGYTLTYECEGNPDFSVPASTNAKVEWRGCELSAGLFGNRTVRMLVSRDADGKRVWQNEVRINPNSGTVNDYGSFNDKDSLSFSIDGGNARLSAAFYSPGGIVGGDLANDRMQAALYLTPSHVSWMSKMPRSLKAAPMSRWMFPGSHDAGMFTGGGVGTNLATTQAQDIHGQLELGIRYFDLRPGVSKITDCLAGNADVSMVHGPSKGGSYMEALRATMRFLSSPEGKNEIVVLAHSGDGIAYPFRPARQNELSWRIHDALREQGLTEAFVGNASDFGKSYDELITSNRRLIIDEIHRFNTLNSYHDDLYKDGSNVPRVVRETVDACRTRSSGIGTVLQLQSTGGSVTTPTLLGNKLVLDRWHYDFIARGGASGCIGGPTFVQNDYVDTALTDVVVRANRSAKP